MITQNRDPNSDARRKHVGPASAFEYERERMMEDEAHDLGFTVHRKPGTGTNWGILVVMLLAALAVPAAYIAFGVLSGFASTRGGFIATSIFLLLLVVAALGAVYAVLRRSQQGKLGIEEQGEYSDMDKRNMNDDDGSRPSSKLVKNIMALKPVACGFLDSIVDCAKVFYKHNVGCVVVLDDQDQCIGIVTDRDLVCGALAQDMDPNATPVTLVMERNFKFVRPNDSLDDVVRLMREGGFRRVPVMDKQGELMTCVGMISVDDLISRQLVTIDDLAPIFSRQLSEPNPRHGLTMTEERVA